MIGRLQTERDKARLLDGMSSAAGSVDLSALSETISGLGKRQFLMQRTGGTEPRRFGVRWAMSYLAGPLSKDQVGMLPGQSEAQADIVAQVGAGTGPAPAGEAPAGPARQSMGGTGAAATAPATAPATSADGEPPATTPTADAPADAAAPVATPSPGAAPDALADDETPTMPEVAPGVPVRHLDPAAPWAAEIGAVAGGARLEPAVAARVELLYDEGDFRADETYEAVFFPLTAEPDPDQARVVDYDDRDLTETAPTGAAYVLPEAKVGTKTFFSNLERALKDQLYRSRTTELFLNEELKLTARPGETREDFEARAAAAAESKADEEADKLRQQLATKADRIKAAMAKDQERLDSAETSASTSKTDELLSGAGSVLGALMGGRRSTRSIAGAVRSVASKRGRTTKAKEKVEQYAARIDDHEEDLLELETMLADALVEIDERWAESATTTTSQEVPLEKADINVTQLALVWVPTAR
jgi:hypothetical protein